MKRILTSLLLAVGVSTAQADVIDPTEFLFRAPVTFPGYTAAETLANFPVLVRLTETVDGFSYANSSDDGSDIRFTLTDGTILASEVSLWNPNGESLVWVSVPQLAVGTEITLYWGGSRSFPASQTDGSVWTTAGYFAVWHMDEDSTTTIAKDSAGGALEGTHVNTLPGQTDSKVGRSVRISTNGTQNQSENKSIRTASFTGLGSQFMFSLWAKYPNQDVGNDRLVSRKTAYDASSGLEISGKRYDTSHLDFRGSSGTSAGDNGKGALVAMKNMGWSHLAFIYDNSTGTFYLNNSWKSSGTLSPASDNDVVLTLGNDVSGSGVSFKGWMDEVRIYKGVPTREWISTEYNSVNNTAFAAVGEAEPLTSDEDIPIVGALSVTATDRHSATLVWPLRQASSDANATVTAWYGTDPANLSQSLVLATGASIATGDHTFTISGLACATDWYLKIVATGADGNAETPVVSFETAGKPVFGPVSGTVAGTAVTFGGSLVDAGTVPLSVTALFGADASSWNAVGQWSGVSAARAFEATATAPTLGDYVIGFRAAGHCPDCGNDFAVTSDSATVTVFGDCRWTGLGGDLAWDTPANWSSGTVPGPLDTAIFDDNSNLSGTTVALNGSRTVAALVVDGAGAFTLGTAADASEGYTLSSPALSCAENDALSFGVGYVFSSPTTITVEEGAEVVFSKVSGTADLTVDGAGTVNLGRQQGGRTGGETLVEGGTLLISNSQQLGSKLTIGGAGKPAVARSNGADVGTRPFGDTDKHQTVILDKGVFDLETDGETGHWQKEMCGPVVISNGGTFLPGKRRLQFSQKSATELTAAGSIVGGVGGTMDFPDNSSLLVPATADKAAVIAPHLTVTTAVKFQVEDILDAPVDLTLTGGISYGWHPRDAFLKLGDGVLRLTGASTYGGGGDLNQGQGTTFVRGGTLLVDNETGSGTGNSLVTVESGATLGGTGRIGGLVDTVTHWSGNNGNGANTRVTARGSVAAQAIVAPGTIDAENGSHVTGTLTVGVADLHHPVTFGDYSTLRIAVGESGADALVVNGAVDISETGTSLELSPANSAGRIQGGTYTILSATDGITGEFATLVRPGSGWNVSYETETVDGSDVVTRIVMTVPGERTILLFR